MTGEKTQNNCDIINTIETSAVTLRMRNDGIVHVTFKKDTIFDIEMQMELLRLSTEITGGKKSNFIYDAEEGVTITKEARDNATAIEHLSVTKATAVVANNLAYRIIANFYVQFNKPVTPFKVVDSLDNGIAWLKTLPE